jgi:drug/metabolite transporter (DMT)-like permease
VKHDKLLVYVAFATVCIVWGTTYLGIRVAVETIPPLLLTGVRYFSAGLIMLAIVRLRGEKLPRDPRVLRELAVVGALTVGGGNLAVVWAEQYVPSGMAALLVATAPFWASILEALRKNGEEIGLRRGLGMLVGFLGVALLVTPSGSAGHLAPGFLAGAIVIQIGSICWQYGMVRGKHKLDGVALMPSSALQMLFGGTLVLIAGLSIGEARRFVVTPRTFAALVYLTIFGSVIAYSAFVFALAHMKSTNLSLYAYVNPAVAVVLGSLILGEKLTIVSILAMVVILGGVAIVQTTRAKQKPVVVAAVERQGKAA